MMDANDDTRYGQTGTQRYYGKYAGVVTDNGAPADGSAHRGQVKVQVPGILEETPDGQSHQPIEVLAYPAFLPGFFFVPANQDPVWVEFVAGDINFPIWTGVWYPDNAAPKAVDLTDPTQAGNGPTLDQKIIRTPSGHVIQLDDTSGSEQLVIKDETNGNTITSDATGITVWVTPSGGSLTLNFGDGQQPTATLVIEDNNITLTAGDPSNSGGTITLTAGDPSKGGSSITVDAASGIALKCGSDNQILVDSSQLTLKTSGVNVTINASAMDVN